jgi:hypothetical protein
MSLGAGLRRFVSACDASHHRRRVGAGGRAAPGPRGATRRRRVRWRAQTRPAPKCSCEVSLCECLDYRPSLCEPAHCWGSPLRAHPPCESSHPGHPSAGLPSPRSPTLPRASPPIARIRRRPPEGSRPVRAFPPPRREDPHLGRPRCEVSSGTGRLARSGRTFAGWTPLSIVASDRPQTGVRSASDRPKFGLRSVSVWPQTGLRSASVRR